MSNKNISIQAANDFALELAQTISTWLIYNSSVGGKIGVQENMIDYPIKAFLICHQNEWETATFEENHPYLSYRRIDFHIKFKSCDYYFEFKQAKKETNGDSEFQRVFNDLMRLSICKKKKPKDRCFFIMFGDVESYKNFFIEGKNDNMNYSDCFAFSMNESSIEKHLFPKNNTFILSSSELEENELYCGFKSEYEKNAKLNDTIDKIVPDELFIKLKWTNYSVSNNWTSAPVVVGLWEILLELPTEGYVKIAPKPMNKKDFIDSSTGIINR